jgi:hypothetical protein
MGLRWALVAFGLRFGLFGHFGSVLRGGMTGLAVGVGSVVLWL